MKSKYQKGFSLLEVLITLILTTVGILGVVAMQSRSIQYTQDSVERNNAIMLTEQIIGIMRSNYCAIYENFPPLTPIGHGLKPHSLFYSSSNTEGCSGDAEATTRARLQRDAWITQLESTLPSAQYSVCQSSAPNTCDLQGSMLEIRVSWRGRDENCHGLCSFTTRVEI